MGTRVSSNIHDLVGFYVAFKQSSSETYEMVFKIKNILDETARGNRCSNSTHSDTTQYINNIISPNTLPNGLGTQPYLCVLLELLLRLRDNQSKDISSGEDVNSKRCMLSPIEYIISSI